MLAKNVLEWNDQGCLVGGTTVGRRIATCVRLLLQLYAWLHQPDHLHYYNADLKWVQFLHFSLLFCSIIV